MSPIKILAISGSPVTESSTDFLLDKIARSIETELRVRLRDNKAELEIVTSSVRLNQLNIIPCQACGIAPDPDFCFYDDDLTSVYRQLAECDCLLFGSPIHFDGVSSQAKLFIDRCNCFRPADFENKDPEHDFLKRLPRKRPGAMVFVGGKHAWFEGARRTVAGVFKWLEVTNEGMISFASEDYHLKNMAQLSPDTIEQTHTLGQLLAKKIIATQTH
ncbi:MAG: flavodoxin family protein [candidate division Zixibacteria bacterium]|nr:flavodoxin family protein [candidate division Zixibacteria bacterium]